MLEIPRQYIFGRGGILGAHRIDKNKIAPLIFVFLLSLLWSGKGVMHRLNSRLWKLLLSSFILYVSAWIFLPLLYFPARHALGMTIFLIIASGVGLAQLMRDNLSLSLKK